ncbi:Ribose import ATP-binding protein RbsA [anaerobic digester metagenome]
MKHITKAYGALVANNNIALTLNKGEILAVVGENGAGKSTLMKILYGLEPCDSGEILVKGELKHFRSPYDAIENGIGMVQQHFMLFPPFTAAENIVYGHEPKKKAVFFNRKEASQKVRELCKRFGLYIDPDIKVADCPVGLQQRIEILKVLYQGVEIIIFDEPTAVLTPQEVAELLKTIKELKKAGKSIILITHKLSEVMEVADRVMVMRHGQLIKTMSIEETSIAQMSYLMVGHKLETKEIKKIEPGEKVLQVEHLTLKGSGEKHILDDLNIYVRSGEIVGIAGVSGNGQSELIQCITGIRKFHAGKVIINNSDVSNCLVQKTRESGCACIPEDRYLWGSAAEATLSENAIMSHYCKHDLMKHGIFNKKNLKKFSNEMLAEFDVRYTSDKQEIQELSGGNAQKLIVAREISQKSPFLIAAEPTRGIDIGAIDFIHSKLIEKREMGDGILLISSELTEIFALSDRIYIMYEGRIAGEFSREEATKDKVGLLMMGGTLNG